MSNQTPAYDIALYLESIGIGVFADTLHVSREPAGPDDVVTLYDTGGTPLLTDHDELREHTIQIRVRSTEYLDGYQKQQDIFEAFLGFLPVDIGDYNYPGLWATTDILPIGRDDNDRFLFTCNYRALRQPTGDNHGPS
jgi:hypothetical protein